MRNKNRCYITSQRFFRTNHSINHRSGFYMFLVLVFVFCGLVNLTRFNNTFASDSISISAFNTHLALSMTPGGSGGTFRETGSTDISISTTSSGGYNLSVSSLNGTNIVNTEDSTKFISSISSAISLNDFTSSTNYNNKWGYKPSHLFDASNDQILPNTDFHPLPDDNGETIAQTSSANEAEESDDYSLSFGVRINTELPAGTYTNITTITATANMTGLECDGSKLCVEYEGNGLTYDGDPTNRVNYDSVTTTGTVTRYAHTTNINDNGDQNGYYTEQPMTGPNDGNVTMNVIEIPGASSVTIDLTYDLNGRAYILKGRFDTLPQNPPEDGLYYYETQGQDTITVDGDTVTIFAIPFDLADENHNYGYYAVVSGTGVTKERTVTSGEYAEPTGTDATFLGWSTTPVAPGSGHLYQVEYTDESDIMTNLPGDNGDEVTLYAVWQQLCDNGDNLCVNYSGNGLTFGNDDTNHVKYNSAATQSAVTKYSHTPNIGDDGTVNGKYDDYGVPINTNDVVTIDGASSLHVTITYETESTSYDWAVIWEGDQSSYSARDNYSSGITCDGEGPKLGGSTRTTKECDIPGDTVTFGFYGDDYKETFGTYGYYAVVSGTGVTKERTVATGEYAEPTGTSAAFLGWSTRRTTPGEGRLSDVEYADESEVMANIPGDNGDTETLYAVWRQLCDNGDNLCVNYSGNGLTFNGDDTNHVKYNSVSATTTITKYAHTTNIDDNGTQNGYYTEEPWVPSGADPTMNVIEIPGASSVMVDLTYDLNGWVYILKGRFDTLPQEPPEDGFYHYETQGQETITVDGDVVTIFTMPDSAADENHNYGYYAVVSSTGTIYSRTTISGAYAEPTGTNATFYGWSVTQTTPGEGHPSDVEYADESEVKSNMPGENGDIETLYAVWQQEQTITFTYDSNVTSISVLDSNDNTIGTISNSGGTLNLLQGNTYTIKPTHANGYFTNAITKTTGAGMLNGKKFTVGAGSASINVTSKIISPIQNYDCSTLGIGEIEQVYDTRDGEEYSIARLADGRCWMLDNLRLGSSSTTPLTPTDTNIEENYSLPASRSDCFSNNSCSGEVTPGGPTVAAINADSKDILVANYGEGSGKVGVYYNYCAASAGTYCPEYGQDTNKNPKNDVCPVGWRLPTDNGSTSSGSEYPDLMIAYNSNTDPNSPNSVQRALSITLSGYYYSANAISDLNESGYFWASGGSGNSVKNILYASTNNIWTGERGDRSWGIPIRCIAKERMNYTLNFDKNTTDAVENLPDPQTDNVAEETEHTFVLPTDASNIPTRNGYRFAGWSEYEDDTIPSFKYNNGEFTPDSFTIPFEESPVTLYAIWYQDETITFTFDSHVTSINVYDYDDDLVGTITNSGDTLNLAYPLTYRLEPVYVTGYINDTITKTIGAGTLDGDMFTVGDSNATIDVTSREPLPIQNYNCSNLINVGDTDYVKDTRDQEIYLIGKLEDGNCWMLDNLRLDLNNSDILTNVTDSNTNSPAIALNYLKNGGGTILDQYPTTKINNAAWTSSSQNYYSIPMTSSTYKNTIPSTTYGDGSGKIGVYYNYCAASAGNYCWGEGTSHSYEPSSDPNPDSFYDLDGDICPKGWRLPTGGPSGEYNTLYTDYNSNVSNLLTALSTPLSGYFVSGSASNQDSYGYFSSATYYNSYYTYRLNVSSSNATPTDYAYRSYGQSIRCRLMDTVTYTLNYDKNTEDSVSNVPSVQTETIQNDTGYSFTIPTDASSIPTRSGWIFAGWSESSSDITPTYQYDDGVFTPSTIKVQPSDSPKTLYAVWWKPQTITFTFDSHVTSVNVLDSDTNTVGTIAASGDTITLNHPLTFIIEPSYDTFYKADAITIISGAGTLNDNAFTVGIDDATINVTSQPMEVIQNYDCSRLANAGDTEQVYDNRDGEYYLIGKLADGNCWMLDNLSLDLSDSTTLANLSAENTNSSMKALNHLKNGDGTITDQYPTMKVNSKYWLRYSGFYSIPMIGSTYKNNTATPKYGKGSNKVGVYYNYCAASAGNYCRGDRGKATNIDPKVDPNPDSLYDIDGDICPKGWRLPTGSDSGEQQALYNAYNNIVSYFTDALSTTLAGTYRGSQENKDSAGNFWSSTWRYNTSYAYMYSLAVNYSPTSTIENRTTVSPTQYSTLYTGLSIRCKSMDNNTYSLNFNQNTEDPVSNMPPTQSETAHEDISHIYALPTDSNSIPSRSGYTFAGWSESSSDTIPTYKYNNGAFDSEGVRIYSYDNPKTLYAVWWQTQPITFTFDSGITSIELLYSDGASAGVITTSGDTLNLATGITYTIKPTYVEGYNFGNIIKISGDGTINNDSFTAGTSPATINVASNALSTIQNFDCTSLGNNVTRQVYDTRDGEIYTIGKLADGRCWMLDNLRLDLNNSSILSNVTESNTNSSATALNYLKNGGGTATDQYPISKINDTMWEFASQNSFSNAIINTLENNRTLTAPGNGSGRIGIYYNYCAASAGNYCWGDGGKYEDSPTDDPNPDSLYDIDGDICPKGWRLPTGSDSGEYQTLYTAYSKNISNLNNALSVPYAGYYRGDGSGGSNYDLNSVGYLWTSTTNGSTWSMNVTSLQSSYFSPGSQENRSSATPIRCVAMNNTTYTLNYNENTTDSVSNMPSTQSYGPVQDDTDYVFTLSTDPSNIPTRSGWIFAGWSESSSDTVPTYKYINGNFTPGTVNVSASETPKTLYAIWYQPETITFNFDSNVTSISVLDPDGATVDTISSSGETLILTHPLTYTIEPTHTIGYVTNAITKTTGAGTLEGNQFTVGAGPATINVTSEALPQIQNFDCSSIANVGDTQEVFDTRDGEVYLVGKLADNKCWMLENLRLDITNSTILDSLTPSNTHVDSDSLTSLKYGNRSLDDRYATSGIEAWDAEHTTHYYNRAKANADYKDTLVSSHGVTGKVGVYYNYCAASAGNYCYDYQAGADNTFTLHDTYDLCPAGWRMPTGSSEGEYQTLYNAYSTASEGQANAFRTALSTTYAGFYNYGSPGNQGNSFIYWASTYKALSYMHEIYGYESSISFDGSGSRDYGHSIRCLAMATNTYTLNYNENTTDSVSNMPSTQSYGPVQDDTDYVFTLSTDPSNIPTRSGWIFAGWSESSSDTVPTYKYINGDFTPSTVNVSASETPKTLYAIWYQPETITFTNDSNITSISVLDPDGATVGTINSSGETLILGRSITYTIDVTHSMGYALDVITKTAGEGDTNGRQFTVGAGSATLNIASKQVPSIQNFDCSSLTNIGDTEEVYDTRDGEVYLIGKLADNKCWMLDNLRLDIIANKNNITSSNTNASDTQLNYLKNGGGDASNQYPTTGVDYWTVDYTNSYYSIPLVAIRNAVDNPWNPNTTTTSWGEGSGKIGIYYNYCAATAGTYCWGNVGTSYGSPSSDPKPETLYDLDGDICPKGWRMPTSSNTGEYKILYDSYASASEGQANAFRAALSTPLSGSYGFSSANNIDRVGYFWSSTWYNNERMYYLNVESSTVYPSGKLFRTDGVPLRCLIDS